MDIDIMAALSRLVVGMVLGFCIGLTGIGGGILVLPYLTLGLGLPPSVAVGTGSLYSFLTRIYATYRHLRNGVVDLSIAGVFLVGALPANILVSRQITRYVNLCKDRDAVEAFQSGLLIAMVIVIFLSATLLLINLVKKSRNPENGHTGICAQWLARHSRLRGPLAVMAGAAIGGLMGATSVGGGVLCIPLLIVLFGLSTRQTVGTATFIALLLTLVTAVVYSTGGELDIRSALLMAVGSLAGVHWGSHLVVKLPEKRLQTVLVVIVFLSAVLMLFKQGH